MRYSPILTVWIAIVTASVLPAQGQHAGHNHTMSSAHAEPSSARVGPHGGSIKVAGDLQIETVVDQSGIQMFAFDRQGAPVSVDRGRGAAILRVEGNAKRYRYDLLPDGKGGLLAPVNLSQIAGRQIEVDAQLVGIGAAGVRFNEVATVPASDAQLAAGAIARQKICPVSGKPLGSMGEPVGVEVQGRTIFVCCAGCVDAVKADPARYTSGRPEIHVAVATAADAPAIAKQKVCPVMDEPLGGMGTPIKVTVGDKPIYLCCKGCIKKVQAEPAKYLAMVYGDSSSGSDSKAEKHSGQMTVSVVRTTPADAPLIAAQKTCPVMDEPLGSMGGPVKLMVGGKPIFLCCRGCIKKVEAEPAKYMAMVDGNRSGGSVPSGTEQVREGIYKVSAADAPYIAAQKKCPVMDEPLNAMGGPYKVNANGKAIYICCPGCAKRIAADPDKYLAILNGQGVSAPMIR
ncbi:hypothetical protein [Roseiconus nitratireducens]|nr:hypothetical protein [Roseiconus nitratireducens]